MTHRGQGDDDALLASASFSRDVWPETEVPAMNEQATQSCPCSCKPVRQLFFLSPPPFKIIFLSGASHMCLAMCALSKREEKESLRGR